MSPDIAHDILVQVRDALVQDSARLCFFFEERMSSRTFSLPCDIWRLTADKLAMLLAQVGSVCCKSTKLQRIFVL